MVELICTPTTVNILALQFNKQGEIFNIIKPRGMLGMDPKGVAGSLGGGGGGTHTCNTN